MKKFKIGDRVEVVEVCGGWYHWLGCVGVVVTPNYKDFHSTRFPIVIEWKNKCGIVLRSDVTEDGWMYAHKTSHNFRFAVVDEFEGSV